MSSLLRLYPASWRSRYRDEMEALLEERPPNRHERVDLVRGAIDAWVHPPTPSIIPILAALIGGGLWTIVATAVLVQPVPPDWPGYLAEVLPLAGVAAGALLVAAIGCLLRIGDATLRTNALAMGILIGAYVAWMAMLAASILGWVGGPPLAAAQALAMVATIVVGLILVRANDEPIGSLLVAAPAVMLLPWTATWLLYGAAWTAIGLAMILDRAERTGAPTGDPA